MSPHILRLVLVPLSAAIAVHAVRADAAGSTKRKGESQPGATTPTPADPYPLTAAGWGPELGNGLMASRWAEDWSVMAASRRAPAGKALPVGKSARLTLSSEIRLRSTASDNAQLIDGNDLNQNQMRVVLGADLVLNPSLRIYGEVGAGHVDNRRDRSAANFENDIALQQIFVDARGHVGDTLMGAMFGRQEFSDGPRQLVSLSDGPNLHRTWNGMRLYMHGSRVRLGAFDLRATRLGRGGFDERVNSGEALQGVNASLVVSEGSSHTYLDSFWMRSRNDAYRVAGRTGQDRRGTYGARLWGRRGALRFDWTAVRQTGWTGDGRPVDAWAMFAVQSLALSDAGWKPGLTSHVDVAPGGGTYGTGTVRDFNPLYASSNYLGEGQFLGLTNLLMVALGITLSPTAQTSLALEYGHARRLDERDAVYAGGARAYAGTPSVAGHHIGSLARLMGTWSVNRNLAFRVNAEHLAAGGALRRTGLSSGTYTYLDAVFRH